MAAGISEQHIDAPCETIAEGADEATAERLREMAAEDSVVIATTANSALADYFDNHINLEELQ